jgi:hypothetical protein
LISPKPDEEQDASDIESFAPSISRSCSKSPLSPRGRNLSAISKTEGHSEQLYEHLGTQAKKELENQVSEILDIPKVSACLPMDSLCGKKRTFVEALGTSE